MRRRHFLTTSALAGAAALLGTPTAAASRPDTADHNAAVLAGLGSVGAPMLPWEWIVVHHTATRKASVAGIDRYHRKRFDDPLGCQYHFVINNGKKLPAGWIEVARWRHQARGVHLFHPERAPRGVAICLVGNFEETRVPGSMLDSLVSLTRAIMTTCEIPVERVTTHRAVDGRLTQCPGKHFPREAFLGRLG